MQRAAPASAGMAKVAAMNVRPGPIGVSGAPNGNIPQLNVSSVGSGPQAAAASAQPPVAAPSASQAATTAAQQAQAQQNHQQQYIRELKRAYVVRTEAESLTCRSFCPRSDFHLLSHLS